MGRRDGWGLQGRYPRRLDIKKVVWCFIFGGGGGVGGGTSHGQVQWGVGQVGKLGDGGVEPAQGMFGDEDGEGLAGLDSEGDRIRRGGRGGFPVPEGFASGGSIRARDASHPMVLRGPSSLGDNGQ
jgi:hypothetical protein